LTDYLADFLALREANDRLRQRGIELLWGSLNLLVARFNETIEAHPEAPGFQLGRQEWQFSVKDSTMIGERFGLRYNFKTLIFELGWPRLPEHGYVLGSGLARGRIGFSQNVMLEPRPLTDLVLRRVGTSDTPRWYFIDHEQARGDELTEAGLHSFILPLLDPS
jgi:hypothetical protein